MVITIICVAAGLAMAVCVIVDNIRCRKKKRLKETRTLPYIPDLSVSDYLARMEKAGVEIARERERQPKYQMVLWLVVEGLRLNDDGTTEWIQRKEETPKLASKSGTDHYLEKEINELEEKLRILLQKDQSEFKKYWEKEYWKLIRQLSELYKFKRVYQESTNSVQPQYFTGCQNAASQIQTLQSQLQSCCIQQTITEQNQQIINALNTPPIPYYTTTCFYNTPFNHCGNSRI